MADIYFQFDASDGTQEGYAVRLRDLGDTSFDPANDVELGNIAPDANGKVKTGAVAVDLTGVDKQFAIYAWNNNGPGGTRAESDDSSVKTIPAGAPAAVGSVEYSTTPFP